MNNRQEEVLEAIKTYTAKVCETKESARQALIDEGFYDEDGNLTPEYGGKKIGGK